MTKLLSAAGLVALLLVLGAPSISRAQEPTCQFRGTLDALGERPSPLDSVQIRFGDATAKLCYGRPSARGRAMVGGQLPFGTPWEMGANEPTTIHLPFPGRVGTVDLPPGSYSLYAIPGEVSWTIVVNDNPYRWGTPLGADVRASDLGSFAVTPQVRPQHVETLTFTFRPDGEDAGSLVYQWERLTFSIPIARY